MRKGIYLLLAVFISGVLFFLQQIRIEREELQKQTIELKAQIQKFSQEAVDLKAEIEELRFGSKRLLKTAQDSIEKNNQAEAVIILKDLISRHSASAEAPEAQKLLAVTEAQIKTEEERLKKEAEQKKEKEKQEYEKIIDGLKKKTDEINNITWMTHKKEPVIGNYARLYFGTKDGDSRSFPVRLVFQYYGSDWIFSKSITIKADDIVYEEKNLDFKRDNGYGSVWEWTDEPVENHEMLNNIMNAKKVIIRFNGEKYYHDFILSKEQQALMKDVYKAWKGLGGVV